MGEVVSISQKNEMEVVKAETDLIHISEELLLDVRADLSDTKTISVPIAELSTLGAGISSLIPVLNTVTQSTTVATEGVYQLANAGVGDVLKVAKNGNFWGAFKTVDGTSKFAQLQEVSSVPAISTTTAAINPATMMMAVALFSIEKELGNIAEMERQILSFLEVEKESEIEADVEMLMDIVKKYKSNWDNEYFVSSNHKLVLDIQRTARKNMSGYQKKVTEILDSKQLIIAQSKVNSTLNDLEKKFKYYRLSLYTFSLASLMEVMLSGNFKEEYVAGIKDQISGMSEIYRDLFGKCSIRLEKMGSSAIESNVLKGIGAAGNKVGKFIGSIPLVKNGQVDEFLQESGEKLKLSAKGMEKKAVNEFASIANPETGPLLKKMEDIIQIYNHTERICFNESQIYLVAN